MAQIRGGKAMEEVAASVGAHVVRQSGMQLIRAEQYKALGREFLTTIFAQKPGEVFASGAPDGVFIAKLDAVRPGDVATTAQFLEAIRTRASQDYLRDLLNAAKVAAQKAVKVSINIDLARQTMGVDPATIAKPTGAKDGKQK
jgi:hypothetical protein